MAYEEVEYLADPDFLATVEVYDDTIEGVVRIEIGYGFKNSKGQGARILLSQDARSKQLLYEAATLHMVPFRRSQPSSRKPKRRAKAEAKPRTSYRSTALPARR